MTLYLQRNEGVCKLTALFVTMIFSRPYAVQSGQATSALCRPSVRPSVYNVYVYYG